MVATRAQLDGVRVLDLGMWRPVPYATQLLAELGATVTKVEPPGGDPMRVFPSLYRTLNHRKEIVELDLKSDDGRSTVTTLMARSDVVIEGFRPGVADRLGVGWHDARDANPRVIHCSVSGFGQTGPLAHASGHDLDYQAWSGVLAARLPEVHVSGIPVADLAGGTFAAFAVTTALARRGLVGIDDYEGERIDVSMADVLASWAGPEVGGALAESETPGANFPGYGTFECADGWVTLGIVTEDHFWQSLCETLGLPAEADLDASARATDGSRLRAAIAAALATQHRDEIVATLLAAGIPAAPVLSRAEAVAHPHFSERGTFVDGQVDHPTRYG